MEDKTIQPKIANDFYNERTLLSQEIDKSSLKTFIGKLAVEQGGTQAVVERLDKLKWLGFHHATQFGTSLSIEDLWMPYAKEWLIQDAEYEEKESENSLERADMDAVERLRTLIDTWSRTGESLKKEMVLTFQSLDPFNPIFMMAFSGARGNWSQVHQLLGMRGLMSDPQGQIIDLPIRSNFREGLSLTEYIISCYGARKGVVDTAVRTASSGYLTRRLVDVAQHVIVRSSDCHTSCGFWTYALQETKPKRTFDNSFRRTYLTLGQRLIGRVLAQDIRVDSKLVAGCGDDIGTSLADTLSVLFPQKLRLRSPFTCAQIRSICQSCYGWNLAQGTLVTIGEAVGIVAAQSIGEPGTQLTMRTFHTGGVFSGEVAEQVRSPFNGFVYFNPGQARRVHQVGKNKNQRAWLIQEPIEIIVLGTQAFVLQVPAFTLIFLQPGQAVLSRQVIAEIRCSLLTFTETANKVIHADLNGQVFFQKGDRLETLQSSLFFEKKKSYSRLPREHMSSLRQGVRTWVMAAHELCLSSQLQDFGLYKNYDRIQARAMLQNQVFSFSKPQGTLFFEFTTATSACKYSHAVFPDESHLINRWGSFYSFSNELKNNISFKRKSDLCSSFLSTRTKKQIGSDQSDWIPFDFLSYQPYRRSIQWPSDFVQTKSQMRELLRSDLSYPVSSLRSCSFFAKSQKREFHGYVFLSQTSFVKKTGTLLQKIVTPDSNSGQFIIWDEHFIGLYPWNMETSLEKGLSPWAHGTLAQSLSHRNGWFPRQTRGLLFSLGYTHTKGFVFLNDVGTWRLYNEWNIHSLKPIWVPSLGFQALYAQLGAWAMPKELLPYFSSQIKAFSGYVKKLDANHLTLRQGSPYLANPGTVLFQGPGSPICQGEPLIGLVYTRPKTADIVQGLPKVDRLLEARISHPLVHYAKELFYKLFQANYQRCFQKSQNTKPVVYAEANLEKAQVFLLNAVQEVYQSQKVGISDRHLELIVRQMTSLVVINGNKEIRNQPGDIVRHKKILSYSKIINDPVPTYPLILGITRAALTTDSFLSEAGFQETSRVLARSATRGRVDWLKGIKGRVMIGELIPAGTGVLSASSLFVSPIILDDEQTFWYQSSQFDQSSSDSIFDLILSIQQTNPEAEFSIESEH